MLKYQKKQLSVYYQLHIGKMTKSLISKEEISTSTVTPIYNNHLSYAKDLSKESL